MTDLPALFARLRETKAIGFFGKLLLKRQVDALLAQYPPVRAEYDALVNKMCVLLHDDDPELAVEINNSREAVWLALLAKQEEGKSHGVE